ncbi:unnamed protein product [Effrenium voratum]|nr:unnamed protein product [Effrenium voratum]
MVVPARIKASKLECERLARQQLQQLLEEEGKLLEVERTKAEQQKAKEEAKAKAKCEAEVKAKEDAKKKEAGLALRVGLAHENG